MNRKERNYLYAILILGASAFAVYSWGAYFAVSQGDYTSFSAAPFALIDQSAPLFTGSSVSASDITFFSSMLGTAAAALTVVSWMLGAKPVMPKR